MMWWMLQVDRRTGLLKDRSCEEPAYTVSCGGMDDAMASPLFLVALPNGLRPEGHDLTWLTREEIKISSVEAT